MRKIRKGQTSSLTSSAELQITTTHSPKTQQAVRRHKGWIETARHQTYRSRHHFVMEIFRYLSEMMCRPVLQLKADHHSLSVGRVFRSSASCGGADGGGISRRDGADDQCLTNDDEESLGRSDVWIQSQMVLTCGW